MTSGLPHGYFDALYAESADPWELASRWYERRKYAITLALLPHERYRHAFEPGCSIGVLTEQLSARCDHVTAVDVADAALAHADARLRASGRRDTVTLVNRSFDTDWPATDFDLVVISEVGYYFDAPTLRETLSREIPRLQPNATILSAHWRHRVSDYPLSGDAVTAIIAATPGLHRIGGYRDDDVVIEVFDTGSAQSVAARTSVPGA
ncbi:SAM-dependent methyltransferase [Mycolicibacterium aichiense]|uniref:Methyltransferase n=1 Tax=Mycolicibacterium aichiense TaxID=1799 RepID=A0AAD1HN90_9MYCO|nr:SAM-dependent methyltransferase [Mycolicibacterium aichiense]MCV7018614.1 methyltransferase domain-containing protein [Mycolicibacterium aichiense]BBX07373.1 methyltransferase [Mycolicibacterium aichiense]STZ81187.1 Nodulation protein S (NodS) [Mycolicibacterium aichiense]